MCHVIWLQEVLKKLASLSADLNEKRAKKAQLEADVHMCTVKLDRAQKLIAGLGGEKTRWMAAAARLGQQFVSLTGDIVLASAQIAYLGNLASFMLMHQPRDCFTGFHARHMPCDRAILCVQHSLLCKLLMHAEAWFVVLLSTCCSACHRLKLQHSCFQCRTLHLLASGRLSGYMGGSMSSSWGPLQSQI